MKIIITEDSPDKRDKLVSYLSSIGVNSGNIVVADTMADFTAKVQQDVDICIIDLRIPAYDGASPDSNGLGVLQAIDRLGGGKVKLLAISSYPEDFEPIRSQFERRGCILADFKQEDVWQSVLKQMVIQVKSEEDFDFIIFCALRKERAPYTAIPSLEGSFTSKNGITRYDIQIAGASGTVIEMPRMGLVDAAITAGRCIDKFSPRVVAMSGICAGFQGRAKLGQLLVSELSYEYQSGKWTKDGFSQEPYQAPMPEHCRVMVQSILEDSRLLSKLESEWTGDRPSKMTPPALATFTTGSAVIADPGYMDQVSGYHRRVAGLDMEVYAIQRAAQIAQCRPDVICAKTVVDLADGDKDDVLQPYGCYTSAKFIVEALSCYFNAR